MDHCGNYIQPLILIANVFFNPELLQDYKDHSARLYHIPSVAPRLQTMHRVLDCKGCSFFVLFFNFRAILSRGSRMYYFQDPKHRVGNKQKGNWSCNL